MASADQAAGLTSSPDCAEWGSLPYRWYIYQQNASKTFEINATGSQHEIGVFPMFPKAMHAFKNIISY